VAGKRRDRRRIAMINRESNAPCSGAELPEITIEELQTIVGGASGRSAQKGAGETADYAHKGIRANRYTNHS
jgi:hypothetical protein